MRRNDSTVISFRIMPLHRILYTADEVPLFPPVLSQRLRRIYVKVPTESSESTSIVSESVEDDPKIDASVRIRALSTSRT